MLEKIALLNEYKEMVRILSEEIEREKTYYMLNEIMSKSSVKPNINDSNKRYFYIYYNCEEKSLIVGITHIDMIDFGQIYFDNEEIAQSIINQNKNLLLKYFKGVTE